MKRKRVLICGASGFIGRNVFGTLSKRKDLEVIGTYHTRAFASNFASVFKVNLTNQEEVWRITQNVDVIIQAAATTSGAKEIHSKPQYHVTDNAIMNSLLFRAAHENHVPQILFFSCSIMYPSSEAPLKETDLDLNQAIYEKYFGAAWTKLYIEKMCQFYSQLGRTKYAVIRHSNIYGPYDKFDLERSHVFGATLTKVQQAKSNEKIVVWGDGQEKRDLLYVSDLVNFVEQAIDRLESSFDVFNVGSGQLISVLDLVRKIIEISGKDLMVELDQNRPTLKTTVALDTSKAKSCLGWQLKVDLENGIQKTLEWCKQFGESNKWI
ncbi:MAG: hypothetical protein A2W61_03020 [Deltaproteobacteria bacterium RIFCSPLOWO2_01_44_7]|nr:MAG: hypothetical protein A2712_02500 [Deltaproteobacteria bacterium RIFCSPHIGHO2_01_FULL_43_49]OGQ16066.1 MAG: hypothetical protein A3D22_00470 [Deltaproteobacteria bacterium RIFCSPHIGHO2_02_FULL_44_53]OGQ29027.1 MAG: hypothetical protein A3D98_04255 [Deltaproteobacteria bacterium RIFCSPHIGHO2_12_FULL_44_21]OGQ32583.1 MAG: hypothetical protein A2979_08400 [Deltaproteobacteria bacterium RIFCSPLOWO2_01_FULL_45_74]OGQ38325.1 MAG: hypothetical protein A2W61_03020 [Deltaproteobacteria bacterium 